jgi:hypothetical protein
VYPEDATANYATQAEAVRGRTAPKPHHPVASRPLSPASRSSERPTSNNGGPSRPNTGRRMPARPLSSKASRPASSRSRQASAKPVTANNPPSAETAA